MEYRRALEAVGDQSVGAWARRRRRRKLVMAAGGVALIGGAAVLYEALRSRPLDRTLPRYFAVVECVTCKARSALPVTPETRFPQVCGACGERAVWPVWRCRRVGCGKEFVRTGSSKAPSCPECGAYSVGALTTQPSGGG